MRLCLLLVTICCVKCSWCIYNIKRHKGKPLVKATTESAAIEDAYPFVTEASSNRLISDRGKVRITVPPLSKKGEFDDQMIDDFNHFPSKKLNTVQENENHNAMATFFEKMSMFQMLMQTSLEAIINRVSDLESIMAIKPEESSDSGHGRKDKNEIIEKKETPLENSKNPKMPEDMKTGNSQGPVSGLKDEDCVEDPKNGDEAPERFIIDRSVDGSNLKKRETFYVEKVEHDEPKAGLQYITSVNYVGQRVSDDKENEIENNFNEKGNLSNKPKKSNFKTEPFGEKFEERKMSSSGEKFVSNYVGHDEETLNDTDQSDDIFKSSANDFSDDLYQTSNITSNPNYEPQESQDFPEYEQVNQPPQAKNQVQLLNRTAFETDRSRENPRVEYQIMKLQRRFKYQMAPKGSDYDCLDDDGIDCPDVAEEVKEDDDKARKLDELTKQDNFQARSPRNDEPFDYDAELINIERAEKKLEELIRLTAMFGELQEVLEILNNFKPGCPYNVPSVKVGDRCYTVELSHLNFNEARQFCKARGGTLAQETLNGYIWSQITKAYPDHKAKDMWIGAKDKGGDGTFRFFDGKEISRSDNRWDANSPSYSGRPSCLAVCAKTSLSFKDKSCDKKQHFICEYSLVSLI